ncbi:MAG: branched-chain amino acid ABC transporter permease [Thermodesulfobacteriota bacterium]
MKQSIKTVGILVVLILAILYPLIAGKFHIYLLTEIMIFSMLGLSYYLLLGHTGLLSMGHAAFFGIGGYVTALLLLAMPGLPISLTLLAGALSGLLAGFIIGSMVLRLTKIYFAFATLALGQMVWAIAWKWRALTGGDDGLTGWSGREFVIPFLGRFGLSNAVFLYYIVLLATVFTIAICWYFLKTPLGNTLAAFKSNPDRIHFLGINVSLAKLLLFGLTGLIAGFSGSLFILFKKMVVPNFLDMFMSTDVVIMSVLGGYSNFVGPIVGSFVYVCMVEYLSSITDRWQLIMGLLFILLILFYPKGIMGIFNQFSKRLFSESKRPHS